MKPWERDWGAAPAAPAAAAPKPWERDWGGTAAPAAPPKPQRTMLETLKLGVGDLAQGVGDIVGIVGNPLNTTLNATGIPQRLTGAPLSDNLGGSAREISGMPAPVTDQEKLFTAINSGGVGGLGFSGGARALAAGATRAAKAAGISAATPTVAKHVLTSAASSPVVDTVGGMVGNAAAEYAGQKGAGPWTQLAVGFGAGLAGGGAVAIASSLRQMHAARGAKVAHLSDEELVNGTLDGTLDTVTPDEAAAILKQHGVDPAQFTDPAAAAARVQEARARRPASIGPNVNRTARNVTEVGRQVDKATAAELQRIHDHTTLETQRRMEHAALTERMLREGGEPPAPFVANPLPPRPARTVPDDATIIAMPEGNAISTDQGALQGVDRQRAGEQHIFDLATARANGDPVLAEILNSGLSRQLKIKALYERLSATPETPTERGGLRVNAPEGEDIQGFYSGRTRPPLRDPENPKMGVVNEPFSATEQTNRDSSPTQADLAAGRVYRDSKTGAWTADHGKGRDRWTARTQTGGSDRAFPTGGDDPAGAPGFWEERSRQQHEEAKAKAQADLEAKWEARKKADEEMRAREKARAEQAKARGEEFTGNPDADAQTRYKGKYSQKPHQNGDFWTMTQEGHVAGEDGSPVAFRNARAAAKWAVDNKLAGDFEIHAYGTNTERVTLRRRPNSTYGERPPTPDGPADPAAGRSADTSQRAIGGTVETPPPPKEAPKAEAPPIAPLNSEKLSDTLPPTESVAPKPIDKPAEARNRGSITRMPAGRTVKEHRMQGWNAARDGWDINDNPYIPTSTISDAWRAGFRSVKSQADAPPVKGGAAQGDAPPAAPFDPLPHLDKAVEYINDHNAGPITNKALAKHLGVSEAEAGRVLGMAASGNRARFKMSGGKVIKKYGKDTGKRTPQIWRRPVRRKGPVDLITQIADLGGIADGPGSGGHDLRRSIGQKFVQGAGPLIRTKGGWDLDTLGEHLHENGWFPGKDRPTVRDVIDLIESAVRRKMYHPDEAAAANEADGQTGAGEWADRVDEFIDSAADDLSTGMTPEDRAEIAASMSEWADVHDAVLTHINRKIQEVAHEGINEDSGADYLAALLEDEQNGPAAESGVDAAGSSGSEPAARDAGQGATDGAGDNGAGETPTGNTEVGVSVQDRGNGRFDIFVDGKKAGDMTIAKGGTANFVDRVYLEREFTGKRYGEEAYNQVEKLIGRTLAPSPLGLSANARPFWRRRLAAMTPEARADAIRRSFDEGKSYGLSDGDIKKRLYDVAGTEALDVLEARDAPNVGNTETGSLGLDAEQGKTTGMTERQRAELDARLKQSKMRRGGQSNIDQQDGGMFDAARDQGDMLGGEQPKERTEGQRRFLGDEAAADAFDRAVAGEAWPDTKVVADWSQKVRNAWREGEQTRAAREKMARGDKGKDDGTTFHSNPMLDPEMWKKAAKLAVDPDVLRGDMTAMKEAVKDPAAMLKAAASPLGHITSFMFSNDGAGRVLAERFNAPSIHELMDHYTARSGMAGPTRGLHEAIALKQKNEVQAVFDLLEPHMADPAAMQRIRDILALPNGRHNAKPSEFAAAKAIAKQLKDFLEYRKDAGVDIGEVTDGYFPRVISPDLAAAKQEQFTAAATKLYQGIGVKDARGAAEAWFNRLYDTYAGLDGALAHGIEGLSGSDSAKSRKFGKEADVLLKDFYEPDVFQTLANYFSGGAKHAEETRRFGIKGRVGSPERAAWTEAHGIKDERGTKQPITQHDEIMARIRAEMLASGEDPNGAMHTLQNIHRANLGQLGSHNPRTRHIVANINAYTQLRNLPKVVITSLGELTMGINRGGVKEGLPYIVNSLKQVARIIAKAAPDDAARWAMRYGINAEAATDLLSLRGGQQQAGVATRRMMANYFKAVGIHQWTQGQRIAAATMHRNLLKTFAEDLLLSKSARTRSRAELYLKEYGIQDPKTFAERMLTDGEPTDAEHLADKGFANEYTTAIVRGINQTQLAANRGEIPHYASHPVGSMLFSLQNYSYAFKKNVLDRAWRLGKQGIHNRDPHLLLPAMSLALMIGTTEAIDTYLKPWIYGSNYDFENETPAKHAVRLVDRSGMTAGASPIINAIESVRYRRGIVESVIGPFFGQIGHDAQAGSNVLTNTADTNTAKRNAYASLYDAVIWPGTAALASTRLAAGVARSGTIAAATPSKPSGAKWDPKGHFVDWAAGPEDF